MLTALALTFVVSLYDALPARSGTDPLGTAILRGAVLLLVILAFNR